VGQRVKEHRKGRNAIRAATLGHSKVGAEIPNPRLMVGELLGVTLSGASWNRRSRNA
jgi:hypothetical protein